MRRLIGSLLFAAGLAAVLPALAQDTALPVPTEAPAPLTDSQQFAREALVAMARYLGSLPKFSVTLRAGYDSVQANGQKVEFGERREVSVERPGRFLSVQRDSDGRRSVMLFDGETITVSDAAENVYARAPQPGDLDASIMYFVRDLKMRLPVAPLFVSSFAGELERRVREVDYVEQTDILGEGAHHLAGRTDVVDFQVWVSDSERPLPLRMILGYRNEPGQPQFWVDFTDWKLKPRFGRDTFRFKPPKDSREIVFFVQMAPVTGDGSDSAAESTGEVTP